MAGPTEDDRARDTARYWCIDEVDPRRACDGQFVQRPKGAKCAPRVGWVEGLEQTAVWMRTAFGPA